MKMSRPRTCINCKSVIPLDTGFSFDKDLNLICDACGKIAIPVKEEETVPQWQQHNYWQQNNQNNSTPQSPSHLKM